MPTDQSRDHGNRRASLAIGTKLGVYEVLELIGAGGMGEVYRARDPRLDRDVAVKILPPHLAHDSRLLARFEREAKAIAATSHPNILAIHDVGRTRGILFAVTELLEGSTLREAIARDALSLDVGVDYAKQIAAGLAAAHDRGIVHRDLKPENIFVTHDGRIKILDFGLAKVLDPLPAGDDTPIRDTTPGAPIGTFQYMSPEQIHGSACDHRADLFAFGLIVHEMLTGRHAFESDLPMDTISAILKEPTPKIADITPAVPPSLADIVTRCLEKKPERRFQSTRDLVFSLNAVGSTTGSASPAVGDDDSGFTSVAVLPFADMSAGRDQEYFCDGMAEEVSNALSHIDGLKVTGRTSAFRFKNADVDLRHIGAELGVDALLEGSVRAASNRLRVNAKLLSVRDGYQLWSEQYDRELDDVFAIQDDIAKKIAHALTSKLSAKTPGAARRTLLPAYHAYLKARFHMRKRTDDALRRAIRCAEQSIELDESYAPAHACLADCFFLLGFHGTMAPGVAMEHAERSARRALELDPSASEAHLSLACITATHHRDRDEAATAFEAALRDPSNATAHYWYAMWHLVPLREFSKADEHIDRALEIDPLSPLLNAGKAWELYFARDYESSLAAVDKAFEIDRDFIMAHDVAAGALAQLRRFDEAVAAARKAYSLSEARSVSASILGYVYGVSGERAEAEKICDELVQAREREYVSAYDIAVAHAGLRDRDDTLQWLRTSLDEQSGWVVFLGVEPRFDFLREDADFARLLEHAHAAE